MSVKDIIYIIVVVLLMVSSFLYSTFKDRSLGTKMKESLEEAVINSNGLEREILAFLKDSFLDSRGLLGSEIKNNRLLEYSLLESMGELMEYAVIIKNDKLFNASWAVTRRYFLSSKGYLYWRINRRTLSPDDATSLLDSVRIVYCLIKAYEEFGKDLYLKDALRIGKGIVDFNTYKDYLVDFFDVRTGHAGTKISTFYLDLEKILKISEYIPRFKDLYESSKEILNKAIDKSSVFFYPSYDFFSRRYETPSTVNMIEQVYIAMNIRDTDKISHFLDFIRYKLEESGKIYNSYSWHGEEITRSESIGVYTLLSLLFLYLDDVEMSDILLEKVKSFKSSGNRLDLYNDFYVFDQLEALILLAKRRDILLDENKTY